MSEDAGIPPPRDRDVLTAVLRLVGALAERLTGQTPVVKIENEDGKFVWCRVSTGHVRWETPLAARHETPPAVLRAALLEIARDDGTPAATVARRALDHAKEAS